MEGVFKSTPKCTTRCSDNYPYITYEGVNSKLCNRWCQYYTETNNTSPVEKMCKENYECDALVP